MPIVVDSFTAYWFVLTWRRSTAGKKVLAGATLIKPPLATAKSCWSCRWSCLRKREQEQVLCKLVFSPLTVSVCGTVTAPSSRTWSTVWSHLAPMWDCLITFTMTTKPKTTLKILWAIVMFKAAKSSWCWFPWDCWKRTVVQRECREKCACVWGPCKVRTECTQVERKVLWE